MTPAAYNTLRQQAPRLALALLFQTEDQKAVLATLLLLGLEFDRITAQTSEPMLALIRLKWWQDQIDSKGGEAGPLAAFASQQMISGHVSDKEITTLINCWTDTVQAGRADTTDCWAELVSLMSRKAGLGAPELAQEIGRSVALSRAGQTVHLPCAHDIYNQAGKGSEFLICLSYIATLAARCDPDATPFLIFGLVYQILFRPSSR